MIYRFVAFELDCAKAELRLDGEVVPVEPQVFAVLLLLVGNHERLVTRDEMIEKVWDGRIVSDSALDSRVKSARRAVGDDGKGEMRAMTTRVTLSDGPVSLFDADGAAIIIHGNPDQMITGEPKSGVSGGPRVACGVIQKAP